MGILARLVARACKTQTAAAQALGVTHQRVNDWTSGRRSCPDDVLVRLAEMAGEDPEKVLGAYHFERFRKTVVGRAQVATLAGVIALGALLGSLPGAAYSASFFEPESFVTLSIIGFVLMLFSASARVLTLPACLLPGRDPGRPDRPACAG